MNLNQIETPFLILEKTKLEININRFYRQIAGKGIALRPHGKTAKNIDIINLCLRDQPKRITVSTLKEAEYYFKQGINDLIYAVGIAPVKLDRIAGLIKSGADLKILLDSAEQVKIAAEKAAQHNLRIPVCIEIDSDGHRSGLKPSDKSLLDIARLTAREQHLDLRGVLTHAGGSYGSKSTNDIIRIAEAERVAAVKCAQILKQNNLSCPIVSVGSTPTATFAQSFDGLTEIRAGVYMFMDLVMAGLGICQLKDIAVAVGTSVIGHQREKGWIITDAGWMALSRDRGTAGQELDQGYGVVCDDQGAPDTDLIVSAASQEHGIISSRSQSTISWDKYPVGTLLRILPNHSCATAAMFNCYHVVDKSQQVTNIWERINGW